MDLGLSGKRALVAAASSGLGRAVARALAAEGCRVAICSRSADRIREAAEDIAETTGAEIHYRVCDVRDPAGLRSWIDDSAELMDGLDLVVPNAGGPPAGTFAELDDPDWEAAHESLLLSPVRILRHARPHLGSGSAALLMTSSSVKEPIGTLVLSTVYRAGVAALAKSLATEWAADGIRVNHLIPGRIATSRVAELDDDAATRRAMAPEDVRRGFEQRIPLGRYGDPSEFAAAAVFLLSDAAAYITGATLQVDGGAIRSVV
jgi:3-oxoacyl-[acyl-carrier protein] reductase